MHTDVQKYNENKEPKQQEICDLLAGEIDKNLPEAENTELGGQHNCKE